MSGSSLRALWCRLLRIAALSAAGLWPTLIYADQLPEPAVEPAAAWPAPTGVPAAVEPANFDSTVAPCHNFYQYANGGWIRRATVPEGNMRVNGRKEAWDSLTFGTYQLAEARRIAALATTDPTTQALGYFYGSCLADTTGLAEGAVGERARRVYCLTEIEKQFGPVLTEAYLWEILRRNLAARAQAQVLFSNLKAAAADRIRWVPWLSDSGKQAALARLAAMTLRIQPREAWYTDTTAYRYAGPALTPTDFKENRARTADGKWRSRRKIIPVSPSYSGANVVKVTHQLFLQPPAFDPSGDVAANYGVLGTVLGHEIMHALDPGRLPKLVGEGALAPEYHRQLERLVTQYTVLGQDGEGTLSENLADLAGVLVAYDAFERALQGTPRVRVAGLTPEQRFFVAFADFWKEKRVRRNPRDNHATDAQRVNGVLPHVPAFAAAFRCTPGDRMAPPPAGRSEVW